MANKPNSTRKTIKEVLEPMILRFWDVKHTYDTMCRDFEEEKFEFYTNMDIYFDKLCDSDGKITIKTSNFANGVKTVSVSKVVTAKVKFDIEKLKKHISDKNIQKKVIKRKYNVVNWYGLFEFLKSSGVNFKEFMKYVDYKEEVDESALDKCVEVGEVDVSVVRLCSKVETKSRHYRLTEK